MDKQYVGFKGHIFIIMDKGCFSSAQMMLYGIDTLYFT